MCFIRVLFAELGKQIFLGKRLKKVENILLFDVRLFFLAPQTIENYF